MPLYEYECELCGNRHEELQEINASLVSVCGKCNGKSKRLLSAYNALSSKKGSAGLTCLNRDERCGGTENFQAPCGGGKCCGAK